MAAWNLDRIDVQHLAGHETLERWVEELVVGCVDQGGGNVRMLVERVVVGRHRHWTQVLHQRPRSLGRQPCVHHLARAVRVPR
jgi:hypothetical protein